MPAPLSAGCGRQRTREIPGRVEDAALGVVLLASDALGVDPQEYVYAVAGPLGDLGRADAGVEPGRNGGVAQVVRSAGQ